MKYCNRKIFLPFLMLCLLSTIQARTTFGYFITNDLDTIPGLVKISELNRYTGGLIINGINLESFHSRVRFKGKESVQLKRIGKKTLKGSGLLIKILFIAFTVLPSTAKACLQAIWKPLVF